MKRSVPQTDRLLKWSLDRETHVKVFPYEWEYRDKLMLRVRVVC